MSSRNSTLRVAAVAVSIAVALPVGFETAGQASTNIPSPPTSYPLPVKSLPSHLKPRAQLRLPRVKHQATTIIAGKMDQPAGLMDVQVVSALHIRRAFKRPLGAAAWKKALLISWRESRLIPNAVSVPNTNKTQDWGLFQLNDGGTLQYAGGAPGASALVPRWNAKAAARIVSSVGWWPWKLNP